MHQEPTPTDLLDAIVELGKETARSFTKADARADRVEARLTSVEGEVRGMRVELRDVKTDVVSMRDNINCIHKWMAHTDARFEALRRER